MKKIIFTAINLLTLVLCYDIYNIYKLYQFKDGAGIGIHILGGIVEINDKVPYKNVPFYLALLSLIVVTVIISDIYIVYKHKAKKN